MRSLCRHPVDDGFLTASADGVWCFHSLSAQSTMIRVQCTSRGLNAMELHPDGQIVGVGGKDRKLRIWDIRTKRIGYTFEIDGSGQIERGSIAFSPNGYVLGFADRSESAVTLWDLRKIAKQKTKGFMVRVATEDKVTALRFSPSGQWLAAATKGQRDREPRDSSAARHLFHQKKWTPFHRVATGSVITDIQFAAGSKFIATAAMDSKVRFIGSKAD